MFTLAANGAVFALPSLGSGFYRGGRRGFPTSQTCAVRCQTLHMRKESRRREFWEGPIPSAMEGLDRTAKAEKGLQECVGRRIALHMPLQGEEKS